MFSIVVYANMRGIFSSRAIEEACKTDIRFMWLRYEPAPDHTTTARFIEKNMNGCAEGLFCQLVQKLSEIVEIEFESMFVNGTETEANTNKYSFVWVKAVEKNLVKLDKKAEQTVISMSENMVSANASALNELLIGFSPLPVSGRRGLFTAKAGGRPSFKKIVKSLKGI